MALFGRRGRDEDDEEMLDEEEEEIEQVSFKGALNDVTPNLKPHGRLLQAGLPVAKDVISEAIERHADTVKIIPKGAGWTVGILVDGVPYPLTRLPKPRGVALVQVLKLLSGLDVQERAKPQVGGINAEFEEKSYVLRTKTTPLKAGIEQLDVDIKDPKVRYERPDELGFPDAMKEKVREWTKGRSGVLLGCGAPGTGVTTMAFCLLRCIDAFIYSVFSLTDLEGRDSISIAEFEEKEGDDFDATLQRIIRAEGDVLYVDPLNTPEMAQNVFRNHDKMSFISEIYAPDPAAAVAKLVKLVGDPEQVAAGLRAVFTQKLIRKLCDKCKEAYRPHPKLLQKLGLPATSKVLYRQFVPPDEDDEEAMETYEPCENCDETGYRGRVAMFEMLEITDGIREVIRTNPTPAAIAAKAREEGQPTLQKDGIRLVAEGKTSLEELQRVFRRRK